MGRLRFIGATHRRDFERKKDNQFTVDKPPFVHDLTWIPDLNLHMGEYHRCYGGWVSIMLPSWIIFPRVENYSFVCDCNRILHLLRYKDLIKASLSSSRCHFCWAEMQSNIHHIVLPLYGRYCKALQQILYTRTRVCMHFESNRAWSARERWNQTSDWLSK